VGEAQTVSLDDQSTENHLEWLDRRSKALAELRLVVIFRVYPGDELCQLDPARLAPESLPSNGSMKSLNES
jgi:hypothetical protein